MAGPSHAFIEQASPGPLFSRSTLSAFIRRSPARPSESRSTSLKKNRVILVTEGLGTPGEFSVGGPWPGFHTAGPRPSAVSRYIPALSEGPAGFQSTSPSCRYMVSPGRVFIRAAAGGQTFIRLAQAGPSYDLVTYRNSYDGPQPDFMRRTPAGDFYDGPQLGRPSWELWGFSQRAPVAVLYDGFRLSPQSVGRDWVFIRRAPARPSVGVSWTTAGLSYVGSQIGSRTLGWPSRALERIRTELGKG